MRFVMFMIPAVYQGKAGREAGADFAPSAKDVEAMMKYNEELAKAGALIALDGLHSPATGATTQLIPGDSASVGPLALADYDGDGVEELYLGGPTAAIYRLESGRVIAAARLGGALPAGRAAAAGDYDNDGYPDLFVVDGRGRGRLYRNRGRSPLEFREVTGPAGLGEAPPVRKALFGDLDHDGDLDLLLATAAGPRLYRNNLNGTFRDQTAESGLGPQSVPMRDAGFGDLNGDGRADLVLLTGDGEARLFRNAGEGRFEDVTASSGLPSRSGFGAVAIGDSNNDGALDLFLAGGLGGDAELLVNDGRGGFTPDPASVRGLTRLRSLAAHAAFFFDADNDGFLDLAVAGAPSPGNSGLALLHRDPRGRFEDWTPRIESPLPSVPTLIPWDADLDGDLDLLLSGAPPGVRLLRNDGGNLNFYIRVTLTGLRTGSGKNNTAGVGARLTLRAGELLQTRIVTSDATLIGLGRHLKADVLRVEWPNGVPQTIYFPGTEQNVLEEQILKGSCAFLYTWDGTRYRFVTDIVWRSALGMPVGIMAEGGAARYAPASASREYLRVPGELLAPRNGRYPIQITEELWETAYLDRLRLLVVDHPDSVEILVNERFEPPAPLPEAPLRLHHAVRRRPPAAVRDGEGTDLRAELLERDDRYVTNLVPGRYQGLTTLHDLILDLGTPAEIEPDLLVLNGWIFPTDASINVAIAQAGNIPIVSPALEAQDAKGRWRTIAPDLGFPSGKSKTVLADLSGKLRPGDRRLRVRTNLHIYWDQAYLAGSAPGSPVNVTTLAPVTAHLHARGFSRPFRKGGSYGPHWFDYDSVSTATPWRPIEGWFTRYGDVLPLLDAADDRYVIMAPGDETTVEFDATAAPPLPAGWKRDFLVYSVGWIKDADLNTAHGGTVEPLPFHGMTGYPYGSSERYPEDESHRRYREAYNTRRVGPK